MWLAQLSVSGSLRVEVKSVLLSEPELVVHHQMAWYTACRDYENAIALIALSGV